MALTISDYEHINGATTIQHPIHLKEGSKLIMPSLLFQPSYVRRETISSSLYRFLKANLMDSTLRIPMDRNNKRPLQVVNIRVLTWLPC